MDGIKASECVWPLRVACFSVNMTHAALAISRRPRQELMSLPFLSHSCGKRKPPYFPRTDLSRRRLKSHVSPEITTFSCSPLTCLFLFFSGHGEFPDPQLCAPVFGVAPQHLRSDEQEVAGCSSRLPSRASLSYCISKS